MVLRVIRHQPPAAASSALRTALVALLTALALLGPVAGAARADTFDDIYADYRKTQKIDPCKYTPKELRDAKGMLGSDSDQYAPEFPDALDEAIAASGDCKKESTTTTSGGGAPSQPQTPTTTPQTTTQDVAPAPTTTAAIAPPATTPGPAAVPQPSAGAPDGGQPAPAGGAAHHGPPGVEGGGPGGGVRGARARGGGGGGTRWAGRA
ncbi:hypothetical protein AB0L40_27450, partial [Patulibacter sp. NPDC049589]|uniref:hypothetical protein n=1 Tax=Patulibacter sp. NPDC049589 TaxID=3154731 RepID=UPI00343C75A0